MMGDGDPAMIPSVRVAGRPAANCVLTSVRHAERAVRWSIAVALERALLSRGSDTDPNKEVGSDPSPAAMCLAVAADPTGRCMHAWLTANGSEPSYVDGWMDPSRSDASTFICVFWRLSPVVHVALVLSPMDVL